MTGGAAGTLVYGWWEAEQVAAQLAILTLGFEPVTFAGPLGPGAT